MALVMAVDVGGTFTDLVATDDGRVRFAKASTTPSEPARGVAAAIARAEFLAGGLDGSNAGRTSCIAPVAGLAVSREGAEPECGVVLDAAGQVDGGATVARREKVSDS